MLLLRQDKEKKRKNEIERIENKKNEAIRALTKKHEQKYSDIKEYYSEITNTNMDIIKQLKDDLADANNQNTRTQREMMVQKEENASVQQPLLEYDKRCVFLMKEQLKHKEIKT
jgi:hypothetical protein